MLQHYLKVALRNLLNYKLHSFISVVCLAVGITCFSLMNHFISTVTAGEELPHYERRVNFRFSSPQSEANVFCRKADVDFLEGQELSGIDMLVASSYEEKTEVTVIDRQQRELPLLVQCRCVSPSYFAYHDKKLQNGNKEITAPDEVIISREFARKVFGKEDPTGLVIHLEVEESRLPNRIKDYRIVNVVESEDASGKVQGVDCYFPLSMNPYRILNVSAILSGQTTVESLNKQLDKITQA